MDKSLNGVATEFLYDGLNPVQELNGNNPPSPTAELLTGLNIDEYFTRTDSNGAMSFLTDALGSTLALTDSGGGINTSYTYEPFGKATVSGSNANPYQFTGRENDGTGLYFYRARYYSPTFQRFVSQDPIGFRGADANLYGYVFESPTNQIDPSGLCGGKPCPTLPPHPSNVSLPSNADEAGGHSHDPFWLANQLHTGGAWDYKDQPFPGANPEYRDFGNFNYGFVGAASGFQDQLLLRAAGLYQMLSGTWELQFGLPIAFAPYGDDPRDQQMIRNGIQYYENDCWLQ